ncbi:hypothetical protein [Actinoplanes sp. NPDC049599]|uniref:hypothetical protein n=1 Tax=Actinoplanes sp. NPDC049599 TaxID=3363903 RepID=UPI00379582C4
MNERITGGARRQLVQALDEDLVRPGGAPGIRSDLAGRPDPRIVGAAGMRD